MFEPQSPDGKSVANHIETVKKLLDYFCLSRLGHHRILDFSCWLGFVIAWLVSLLPSARARAEDHVDYRYEFYKEENGRVEVNTHSVFFEQKLIEAISTKGELVYDGISGATPTGVKPSRSGRIPTKQLTDIRRAGNIAFDCKWDRQTITPQVAYSTESDYESYGISLSDAIEFNEKNTLLQFGVSHNFDSVLDNSQHRVYRDKDSTAVLIGISQLLSPKTIFSAHFTYGGEYGYLNDPYRRASFDTFGFAFPEKRPGHKSKEVLLLSLTQYITPLNGSVEGSYRFYHDSFGILSHTATLTWHQRFGKHLIVEPMFRFNKQSAADFYAPSFPGISPGGGSFYSADYRLSKLYTLDYGLQATIIATDWLRFNVGYHRYEMYGLDSKTAAGMYPKANIFTIGMQLWF